MAYYRIKVERSFIIDIEADNECEALEIVRNNIREEDFDEYNEQKETIIDEINYDEIQDRHIIRTTLGE